MPELLSDQGGVAGFVNPTTIHSGSALFPSVTPRAEILTGSEAGAYNQAVVIRHDTVDSNAVTRRLGLLIKLSSEGSSGESAKHVGVLAESTSAFGNSTAMHLVTNDVRRVQIDSTGNMSVGTGASAPLSRLHARGSGGSSGLTPVAGTTLTVENTAGDNNISLLVGTSNSQGIHFGNTTSVVDGGIVFTNTRVLQLRSGNNNTRLTIDSNGAATFINDADNAVTVSTAGTGRTAQGIAVNIQTTGTFNTTAGILTNYGVVGNVTSSRSAGANNLTNVGVYANAVNAQVNRAIFTDNGDCLLNQISGNTAIGGASTSLGKLSVFAASGDLAAIIGRNVLTGQTVHGAAATQGTQSGSYDTTATARTSIGVSGNSTSTRSAGANNLTNVGGIFNASGAQVNTALQTNDGEVILNSVSGKTGVGAVSSGAKLYVLSGSGESGVTSQNTATGQTTGVLNFNAAGSGSYNTTAGTILAVGVQSSITSTRSAGANDLTNTAGLFNASGAQINRALQTNSGDVYLNASSGNTGVGIIPAVKFHVAAGTSSGIATTLSGTVAAIEQANGTGCWLQMRSNTMSGLAWAGQSSGKDGEVGYDQSQNIMEFRTAAIARMNIDANGTILIGDTAGTAVDNNVDILRIDSTGTGQTSSLKSAIYATKGGSYDTTSAVVQNVGIRSVITSTRSAGANNLQNIAGFFDAGGGQENIALACIGGNVVLNSLNGFTQCGPLNENGWTSLYQAADQDVTNAQNTASNTFTFATVTNNIYGVELDMFVSGSNAANDYEFRFSVSAGTMSGRGWCNTLSTADAITNSAITAAAAATSTQISVGTTSSTTEPTMVTVRFCFKQNTADGTFTMQFGNATTGAGIVSRTMKGSRMRWKQLN